MTKVELFNIFNYPKKIAKGNIYSDNDKEDRQIKRIIKHLGINRNKNQKVDVIAKQITDVNHRGEKELIAKILDDMDDLRPTDDIKVSLHKRVAELNKFRIEVANEHGLIPGGFMNRHLKKLQELEQRKKAIMELMQD